MLLEMEVCAYSKFHHDALSVLIRLGPLCVFVSSKDDLQVAQRPAEFPCLHANKFLSGWASFANTRPITFTLFVLAISVRM